MENMAVSAGDPFRPMVDKLNAIVQQLEDAAAYSRRSLHRPEMSFSELREHLANLAELYNRQLARKAFLTHQSFSVRRAAKRKAKPMTEERRRQLIAAGKKGGSKTGLKKSAAAKQNAVLRWSKAIRVRS